VREYTATPGNRGVLTLTRDVDGRTEFVLLSFWNSREDVVAFAGVDIDRAVFYPEDDRFLVARELTVRHYELAAEHAPGTRRD
jgi:heme-degrading monooxygenase HmoA